TCHRGAYLQQRAGSAGCRRYNLKDNVNGLGRGTVQFCSTDLSTSHRRKYPSEKYSLLEAEFRSQDTPELTSNLFWRSRLELCVHRITRQGGSYVFTSNLFDWAGHLRCRLGIWGPSASC